VPVLRALRSIRQAADAAGKPLTLCGEIAGRPLEAMVLLGLGFRSISMAPASIGPVKAMVLSLDATALDQYLADVLLNGRDEPRSVALHFAKEHGVELA